MSSRIYVARDTEGKVRRLVWAGHPSQALKHCFTAKPASQVDILALVNDGVRIELAPELAGNGDPQPDLQPTD